MAVTSKEIRPASPDAGTKSNSRRLTTVEWLSPAWGRKAAAQIEGYVVYSPGVAVLSTILSVITVGIGVGMLFGDGFATIQGVRFTLNAVGLPVRTDTFPSAPWWLIQLVLVIIQIFGKKVQAFRPLWTPSYIFNAATTSIFLAIGLEMFLHVRIGLNLGPNVFAPEVITPSIIAAMVASVAGHFLALGAEQVTMTGLCMVGAVYSGLMGSNK
jgi:hypothetical protein